MITPLAEDMRQWTKRKHQHQQLVTSIVSLCGLQAAARQRSAVAVQESNRYTSATRAAAEQQRRLDERATSSRDLQSEVTLLPPLRLLSCSLTQCNLAYCAMSRLEEQALFASVRSPR